jgi:hypothetical protein
MSLQDQGRYFDAICVLGHQDSDHWIDLADVEAELGRERGDGRTAPALRALVAAEFVAVSGDQAQVAITWKGSSIVRPDGH